MSSCRSPNSKIKPELPSEKAKPAVSRAELEVLRQKAADLAIQKPEKAAVILSDWVNGASGRANGRKKTG